MYGDKKIIEIICREVRAVEEHYKGYQKELLELLGTVLEIEKEHKISRTNVKSRIEDAISAAARVAMREMGEIEGEMTREN